jgi:hypothetical protein
MCFNQQVEDWFEGKANSERPAIAARLVAEFTKQHKFAFTS